MSKKANLLPLLFLIFSSIIASKPAAGFPEMVRHGYGNCISCHISPNGGGVLNSYGRTLSEEVLSTWKVEGEGGLLWGAVRPPDWLNVGGDFRGLEMYQNTVMAEDSRFIFMQTDLEAAANVGRFDIDASAGHQTVPGDHAFIDEFISRRHFVTFHANDTVAVRAGKFFPSYGINFPDHSILDRQQLGWDQSMETYNVEGSYIADKVDFFATAVLGRPDDPALIRDTGFALRSSLGISETYKVGLSYYYGTNPTNTRHVAGPFAILGFSPKLFMTAEWDFQRGNPIDSASQFGWVDYVRFNYEFVKGMMIYATQEMSQLDLSNADSLTQVYGGGFDFFPRPHFEFQAFYQHVIMAAQNAGTAEVAGLMLHFYP